MEFWLLDTLRKIEQQIESLRHEIQRLAILAALWIAVTVVGYHSPTAQALLAEVIKSYLLKH